MGLYWSSVYSGICRIEQRTGAITLLEDVPEMAFVVKVTVRDLKGHSATTTITIDVVLISEDAVYSSGSVRINGKPAHASTALQEGL